jgi:hypothetical protein
MPNDDVLDLEILPDGTIRVTTPKISAANHKSADEFLALLAKECGGPVTRTKRAYGHVHQHDHEHLKGGA